jgi:hypothetical protein
MTGFHKINNIRLKKSKKSDDYEQLRSLWKPQGVSLTKPQVPQPNKDDVSMLVFETSVALLVVDLRGKPSESSFDNELCNIHSPNAEEKVIG